MEHWAHVLWQRHGLRMEEFEKMPRRTKLFYIASELCENEDPCRIETWPALTGLKKG